MNRSILYRQILFLIFLIFLIPPVVSAHVSGRGLILLLPTNLFIAGGAAVVAASFALLTLVPIKRIVSLSNHRGKVIVLKWSWAGKWVSVASLAFFSFLILTGFYGARDPLRNPAPLFIWSFWWPGMTFASTILGDVWSFLNPWTGICELIAESRVFRRKTIRPPLKYPEKLGYIPAIIALMLFAWVELVYPSPTDPEILSTLAVVYLVYIFAGIALFGKVAWLEHCEAFTVFFKMVSWISPISVSEPYSHRDVAAVSDGGVFSGRRASKVVISLPTANLTRKRRLSLSHTLFILLALSTVSFDGFSRTFTWLSFIGVNPLDYPGRTLLVPMNSLSLLGAFLAMAIAYALANTLAKLLVFRTHSLSAIMGMFIPSIIPIALGYHIAHYFPFFLNDIQMVYASFSDPFGLGWNLLGVSGPPAIPSFLKDPYQVYYLYYVQVGLIVLVHVLAVYVSHVIALREVNSVRKAMISQVPMTLLMVAYTIFGLWLLSSPSID